MVVAAPVVVVVVVSPQRSKKEEVKAGSCERSILRYTDWRGGKCHVRPFSGNE